MPMSPRTLRPRQTTHPEAAAWAARVAANGGSVSGVTLSAVSKFCRSIDGAGLRDRFARVNLFCGTATSSLGACGVLVPLYRGPTASSALGSALDTPNVFSISNYVETGASGGLTAPSSGSVFLATGLPVNFASQTNTHFGVYESLVPSGSNKTLIGVDNLAGTPRSIYWIAQESTSQTSSYVGSASNRIVYASTRAAGFWLTSNQTSRSDLFRNGVSVASNGFAASGAGAGTTPSWYVFAANRDSAASDPYLDGRLNGYSLGYAMSAAQALSYYNIMQTFQSALNRAV
jgi:hypothetical protein